MDKNYTVVETSKIAAVRGGGHIYSLISSSAVENGHIGYVGDLAQDDDDQVISLEIHEYKQPATALINKGKVVLVANPEWAYDDSVRTNSAAYNYRNEADIPFRAYDLMAGDVYAVTAGGINSGEAAPTVGKYVIAENGKSTVKQVEASAIAGQGFVGKIVGSKQRGFGFTKSSGVTIGRPYTVYFIEVLRNDVVDATSST